MTKEKANIHYREIIYREIILCFKLTFLKKLIRYGDHVVIVPHAKLLYDITNNIIKED